MKSNEEKYVNNDASLAWMTREERLSNFRSQTIAQFLQNNNRTLDFKLDNKHKVKLCSSDFFDSTVYDLAEKYFKQDTPIIIGNVSGFYETASLAGLMAETCKEGTAPHVLFFNKRTNNIQNAIFNSMLMMMSNTKEQFLTSLLSLSKTDIIKALKPKEYEKLINTAMSGHFIESEPTDLELTQFIDANYIDDEMVNNALNEKCKLKKLYEYILTINYDSEAHYKMLEAEAEKHFEGDMLVLFKSTARTICEYLKADKNYYNFMKFLYEDLNRNKENHILNRDDIFDSYKSLIKKDGTGNIKFLSDVDISTSDGLNELTNVLRDNNIITPDLDKNEFPVDIAIIPHIGKMKNTFGFVMSNVQDYVLASRDQFKEKSEWENRSTATLYIRDHESIGAQFIKDQRDNITPLTHLKPIKPLKGMPNIGFLPATPFGLIYNDEKRLNQFIDAHIANKVARVYTNSLIYGTYYHFQVDRRQLMDPSYETIEERLDAMHTKVLKRYRDAGIPVTYIMGIEEHNIYKDMFELYLREEKVRRDTLSKEESRTRYDWIKPLIKQELIPYMIRSGKNVISFNTDEATETRVKEVCLALKRYRDGAPLGDLAKYIDPQYLHNDDMLEVSFAKLDQYDKDDPAQSVDMIANPNYSSQTQYANPTAGAVKYLKRKQVGAVDGKKEEIPNIIVDGSQGMMSIQYIGDQAVINVPSMVNDEWYDVKELLPGIKENVLSDPTHKRMTQKQTLMNSIAAPIISGNRQGKQQNILLFKRVFEMMEHVQKTGVGLEDISILMINDTQIGSITERPDYLVKMLDIAFYDYNIKGIIGNGDFQQGWNYPKFAIENAYLGSMNVTRQMVAFLELQRPYIEDAMGVVNAKKFEMEDPKKNIQITSETASQIMNHLIKHNLVETRNGMYENVYGIHKRVDYKKLDLKLSPDLMPYEKEIRKVLTSIHQLWFYHLVEGNHEKNTDWNTKGYELVEIPNQALLALKRFTGSDTEIKTTRYFVNDKGDIVNSSYGSLSVNGFNIIFGHNFRAPGKGNGDGPTAIGVGKYFERLGPFSHPFHAANMGHLHHYESSVVNNMQVTVTGCFAGQSGYEQELAYYSQPLFVIFSLKPDGNFIQYTFTPYYLDQQKIRNPYVKQMGLDNFVFHAVTDEIPTLGPEEPKQIQKVYNRGFYTVGTNKVIGPKMH